MRVLAEEERPGALAEDSRRGSGLLHAKPLHQVCNLNRKKKKGGGLEGGSNVTLSKSRHLDYVVPAISLWEGTLISVGF